MLAARCYMHWKSIIVPHYTIIIYHIPLLSGHPNISICQQSRPNVSVVPLLMTSLNRLATIGRSSEKYPDDVRISSIMKDCIVCEWRIEMCSFNNLISDKLPRVSICICIRICEVSHTPSAIIIIYYVTGNSSIEEFFYIYGVQPCCISVCVLCVSHSTPYSYFYLIDSITGSAHDN